ncbi:phosphatidate cytidylyltransferase [Methylobacterium sp. J-068]|uniref:phosphatidate cytidylyltransferase n=1 Tax=Methylobacterium sp. J-068 TaxID=2836649 RepID=UPI001FBB454C|nr:phosphatidate cytidylyltransferase [Methylobacterium sp. J-068]MCJ2033757.1 phosphatidate cytidylyltransferase [Methylobacterium sp. J-068]
MAPGEATPASRSGPFAGREFQARLVSAILLGAVVLSALVIGGWPFAVIWLAAGIVFAAEWIGMSAIAPRRLVLSITAATLFGLVLCLHGGVDVPTTLGIGAVGAILVAAVARTGAGRMRALAGLASAGVIALVPTALRDDPAIGLLGPAWMFAVVWTTDIVAYFTGRTLGGPKLMPRVSPKKTWSGALGGLAGGTLAGIGLVVFARDHGWSDLSTAPLALVGLLSATASILSQGGDLAESALKRRYGVKDSGRAIPGHGGVMDRLDGFFAVAVLAGFYLIARRLAAA